MQLFLLILLWMFHITQVSVIQLIKIPHPCLLVEETKLYPIFEGLPVPEPDEGLTSCLLILRFIDEVVWGLRAPRQRQQLQYARPNRHPVQYIKVIGGLRAPRQRQQLQYTRPNRQPLQYIKVIGGLWAPRQRQQLQYTRPNRQSVQYI